MDCKNWLSENVGNVSGKICIVTGATGTLGKQVTRNLLTLNASVIMAVRNRKKADLFITELKREFPQAFIRADTLDLTSFASIEDFSNTMFSEFTHVDALIHTAGIYHLPKITAEGYDIHYMVNYLAPLKLTELLSPLISNGTAVFVTSIAQSYAKLDPDDLESLKVKNKITIYGRSKLLLSDGVREMRKIYPTVSFRLCHPGIFNSELFSEKDGRFSKPVALVMKFCIEVLFNTPEKSSLNVMYAVTHDIPAGHWVCPRRLGIWGLPKVSKMKKHLTYSNQ